MFGGADDWSLPADFTLRFLEGQSSKLGKIKLILYQKFANERSIFISSISRVPALQWCIINFWCRWYHRPQFLKYHEITLSPNINLQERIKIIFSHHHHFLSHHQLLLLPYSHFRCTTWTWKPTLSSTALMSRPHLSHWSPRASG